MSSSYISNITVDGVNYLIKDTVARDAIDEITGAKGTDAAIKTITVGGVATTKTGTSVNLPAYPTTLPASDVSAWAKEATKPAYTYTEVGADQSGAAASALADAKSYADGLAVNYDTAGAADSALSSAKSYADGLAGNYEVAGAASSALASAKSYADGLASNYDASGSAATALSDAKSYADGLASNYDPAGAAAAVTTTSIGAIPTTEKGANNGVATLGSDGKIPSSQLPAYVDDVVEYTSKSLFPTTGESGKIYIDTTTNITYRWSGTTYVAIGSDLALGETSSTAYYGDKGKTAYDHSQSAHARTDATKTEASTTNGNIKIDGVEITVYTHPSGTNPHGTTKADVGLSNVGNYKAVSTIANQDLSAEEKANARANIGAGTSTFSGNYNDLTNLPTIPTVNNATLTIQKNGVNVQTFTANASANATANIEVPTKTSELTNDSGFKTTDTNTTYTLTQDALDGHKITLTPSIGTPTTITIPDNNTTYTAATTTADGLMSSADKSKLDGIAAGATANVGTVTSVAVKMNGTTQGTITSSGEIDLGTVITSHQNISGKQDVLTPGDNITINGTTISAKDTTYGVATTTNNGLMSSTDKVKLNGIATGATANEGTVTSVAVKMNGSVKGTVTESGTIDLGTVITDVSDKQNVITSSNKLAYSLISGTPTSLPASDVSEWAKASTKPTYTASEVGALASTITHLSGDIAATEKGANNGVATLGSDGKIPSTQLPSYVDDVLEYANQASFPTAGEAGKIYVDISTNKTFRWSGTTYVEISASISLGETSSTAYRGDYGKIAYDHSQAAHARTDATKTESSTTNGNIKINGSEVTVYTHPAGTNPHGTTASDVGLGNVGNFKAVSTVASQGLTDTEKSNARANIGAMQNEIFTIGGQAATVKQYIDSRIFVGTQAQYDAAVVAKTADSTTYSVIIDENGEDIEVITPQEINNIFAGV